MTNAKKTQAQLSIIYEFYLIEYQLDSSVRFY